MKPVVWITGAGGLIGNYLVQTAAQFAPQFQVVGLTRAQLDLTDYAAVRAEFQRQQPQLFIHCAAMSRSPDCQANPVLARKLNTEVPAQLAGIALKIPFVFFSTDLVFDGKQGHYDESAASHPLSVYAETKVAAERIVLANPRHSVVRVSLNFGTSSTGDRSFAEETRRAWEAGKTLKLFTDEFRSPIPVEATARAVWELAAANQPGLYHLGGAERLSRWEIGQLLAVFWPEVNARMEPGSLREYQGAPRPADTSLNCAKIQKLLGAPLPRFSEWIRANAP